MGQEVVGLIAVRKTDFRALFNSNNFAVSGQSGPTDPYFANVSLLMHMDGTNGSTTFTEETGKTVTGVGNAQISTAQSLFGGASCLFDGAGDYLTLPTSADLSITGAFTAEFQLRLTALPVGDKTIIGSQHPLNGFSAIYINAANIACFFQSGLQQSYAVTWATNTNYRFAITRDASNVVSIYLNGSRVTQGTRAGNLNLSAGSVGGQIIGGSPTQFISAYIDELRITKDVARYTDASYDLDTAAFPDQ